MVLLACLIYLKQNMVCSNKDRLKVNCREVNLPMVNVRQVLCHLHDFFWTCTLHADPEMAKEFSDPGLVFAIHLVVQSHKVEQLKIKFKKLYLLK